MSNVLIGIIGVILFIGLALAGALILGDDFRSSRSASTATAVGTQLSQIVAAINMYQLKTGNVVQPGEQSTIMATLQPRFLKTTPISPLGRPFTMVDENGGSGGARIDVVRTPLGPMADTAARGICREIEAQAGAADPDANMESVSNWAGTIAARRRFGCMLFNNGNYVAFLPI